LSTRLVSNLDTGIEPPTLWVCE